jgi:predicted RNase H-like nuclease (RuvC/YqgF family)
MSNHDQEMDAAMSRIGVLRFRLDEAQAELERLRASSFVTAVPSEEYERLQSENKLVREESDRHYQLWVNSQADLEKSDGVVWTLAVENTHLKAEVTDLKSMADRFKAEVESLMTNPTSRLLRAEREDYARLKAEVERLTKAGDNMERAIQANGCDDNGDWDDNEDAMAKWNAAKEGKQS